MIKTDSGGSVANTISTISLLGLESSFCGKVMNDKLGNDFENKMTESGTTFYVINLTLAYQLQGV